MPDLQQQLDERQPQHRYRAGTTRLSRPAVLRPAVLKAWSLQNDSPPPPLRRWLSGRCIVKLSSSAGSEPAPTRGAGCVVDRVEAVSADRGRGCGCDMEAVDVAALSSCSLLGADDDSERCAIVASCLSRRVSRLSYSSASCRLVVSSFACSAPVHRSAHHADGAVITSCMVAAASPLSAVRAGRLWAAGPRRGLWTVTAGCTGSLSRDAQHAD